MKAPALSADAVLQLALLAGLGLAAWWAWSRLSSAAASAGEVIHDLAGAASDVADAVIVGTNPVDPGNWANRAVTAAGSAIVSAEGPGRNADGSWTLGGAIFDLLNPGWSANLSGPTPAPVGLQLWGREARTMAPVLDPVSNEVTPAAYDQLGNLGAP